jgi:aminoglycoside phosphotransferase (APT) family kinase protein
MGTYWVQPNHDAPEMYLPLDVAGALGWYLKTRFTAITPMRRLLEVALEITTGLSGPRFAPLAPCFATLAIAGPRQSGNASPQMLRAAAQSGVLLAEGTRPVLITGSGARAILLPFAPGDQAPRSVIKVLKRPTTDHRLEDEQGALAQIRAKVTPSLDATIPRPLGTFTCGSLGAAVETYLGGSSLLASSGRWGSGTRSRLRDLWHAVEWLMAFHQQTLSERAPLDDTIWTVWFGALLDRYRDALGSTEAEERLFAHSRDWARALQADGVTLPLVWQHGDFSVWNVHQDLGRINVIDWEGGKPGPALGDLLFFLAHWYDTAVPTADEAAQLRGFHALFFAPSPRDRYVTEARHAIGAYLTALRMDARLAPLLFLRTWVNLALNRHAQLQAQPKPPAQPRQHNPAVRYLGVIADAAGTILPMPDAPPPSVVATGSAEDGWAR